MTFRESGKPILAFQDNAAIGDLLVMSAADHVVMPPVGNVMVIGLQAQMYYLKDMLSKLGIEAQSIQTGRYKSAMEMFTHSAMSEDTRTQMTTLVDALATSIAENYAKARGIKATAASELLWAGPYTSRQAHEAGIVTDLMTREQFMKQYAEENSVTWDKEYLTKNRRKSEPVNLFSLLSGVGSKSSRRAAAKTQVALIYALGNIVDGVAEGGPFGGTQVIASEDFLELLDDVIKDGPPKALVVRVDSPGGSAVASDRIWSRLRQIRTEHDIPVVVSMGGVAASGGYYISMGADRIFADESTITGSIGVIMGGLLLGGTYDMIGVNKESIGVGKHVGIMDETRRWEGEDLALLERMRDEVYDTFTRQAAEGRGMTHEAILEVAEGRVWTGSQALQIGLIDEIGGLENAIASARRLADLAADAPVTIYPKEKNFFELLDELFAGQVSAGPIVRAWAGPVPGTWEHLATVLPPQMVTNARNMMTLLHTHPGQAILVAPSMFEIK
jgi:protease-4